LEPNKRVRLHKFKGLRGRRQAYPCTVTISCVCPDKVNIYIDLINKNVYNKA